MNDREDDKVVKTLLTNLKRGNNGSSWTEKIPGRCEDFFADDFYSQASYRHTFAPYLAIVS